MARSRLRLLSRSGAILLVALAAWLAFEVHTPSAVPWEAVTLQGLPAERAEGLVLQHQTGSDVWASRGYALYRSRDAGAFEKIVTILPRPGEAWGGFLRTLRTRFGYQDLVEVLPLRDDLLLAFAGGDIYRIDLAGGTQERVHRLRYFGRGEGRGVLAHGIAIDGEGAIYYGEYPTAPGMETRTVRIWRSGDEGRSWQVAHEFAAGAVRHVHGVQWDPYQRGIWVGTGDRDSASRLGFSLDEARSFTWIGEGSQEFRVVSVLFLEDQVAWGMDADHTTNHVLRWSRSDGALTRETGLLPGPEYFAQPLDARAGLLGLAELDASVWLLGATGAPVRLLQWTLPSPPRPGPHPAVRLARGQASEPRFAYVNPLRTVEDEATIYRLPADLLRARAQAAAPASGDATH